MCVKYLQFWKLFTCVWHRSRLLSCPNNFPRADRRSYLHFVPTPYSEKSVNRLAQSLTETFFNDAKPSWGLFIPKCNKKINKKAVLSQREQRDAAVNSIRIEFYSKSINGTFMYAKHDSLVDADASGANTAQNTLNHIHRSFKVTHF